MPGHCQRSEPDINCAASIFFGDDAFWAGWLQRRRGVEALRTQPAVIVSGFCIIHSPASLNLGTKQTACSSKGLH